MLLLVTNCNTSMLFSQAELTIYMLVLFSLVDVDDTAIGTRVIYCHSGVN